MHGHVDVGSDWSGWLIAAEFATALSYFSLPLVILLFALRRDGLQHRWVLLLSAAFVLACGTTHALGLWSMWQPVPEAQLVASLATAAISVTTAVLAWPLLPKALAVPTAAELQREISERRRAEQQVQEMNASLTALVEERTRDLEMARDEAERANLAKSKFLASASHDLRQPAQAFTLMFEVLKKKVQGTELQQLADQMGQSLEAQRLLLDGILHIGKLDAGVVTIEPENLDLGPLLSRLVIEYRLQAVDKGISVRCVETSRRVRADAVVLERVLRNLIENALKYTRCGGVLVGCRGGGSRVRIDVVDTGIGIAAEEVGSIFDEFYQVDNPSRDRSLGLGLGLAIVRRKVALLGGTIEVASVPGKGSRFSVLLPAGADSAHEQADAPASMRDPENAAI